MPSGKTFYVCVYVDDVIIATDDGETRLEFLKHCKKEFPAKTMSSENAFSFLCMAISFDYENKIIKLDNSRYIKELSDNYGIKDDNSMPYGPNFMSSDPQDIAMSDIRKYK